MTLDLGQYYTADAVASLLVRQISQDRPRRVLDLGVGKGALLEAAVRRWPEAEYCATDVDQKALDALRVGHQDVTFLPADVLLDGLPTVWKETSDFDVAICNPPYTGRVEARRHTECLAAIGVPEQAISSVATGPTVFLALLLSHLRPQGELGVILPDGVITGIAFRPLREALVRHHGVRSVIELAPGTFPGTEARTYIMVLIRDGTTDPVVRLLRSDRNGRLLTEESVEVDRDALIARMDYDWHRWLQTTPPAKGQTLQSLDAKILRGSRSGKDLRTLGKPFLHTCDLPAEPCSLTLPNAPAQDGPHAQKGDIVVARVGTRCIGRRARVTSGNLPISDCIFVIRVPEKFQEAAWAAMSSPYASDWIHAHARGVCARVIGRDDLLAFVV